jgi:hypothetical protein
LLACLFVCGLVLITSSGVAYAGDPSGSVNCPPSGPCTIVVGTPGSSGEAPSAQPIRDDGSAGEADKTCQYRGESFPCNDPIFGWWNSDDSCFYKETNRPSGPADPINTSVGGYHPPGDGTYYDFTCPGVIGTGGGYAWLPSPPPGSPQPALPDPAVLAQRAVQQLGLAGPDIQTSPPTGTDQVVGLPTWLWTQVSATTWGSHSATAAVPGESVTATATAEQIVWGLGDGTTITCNGPGTPYQPTMDPLGASPTCGHTYTASSAGRPAQAYPVTATTTWSVHWAGAGVQGQLTLQRSSQTTLRVVEAQAVNR